MPYPKSFKFTKDHEWLDVNGDRGNVGISDFAQRQLGDVVYIELPEVGTQLKKGASFGTIESVKAVSELYAPVSGEVVAINDAIKNAPEKVNTDPHGSWLIALKLTEPGELGTLLDADQYEALAKS